MGAGAKQVGHYIKRGLNLAKFLSILVIVNVI